MNYKFVSMRQAMTVLDDIFRKYQTRHRADYDELAKLTAELDGIRLDRMLSHDGKVAKSGRLQNRINELRADLAQIEHDSRAEFEAVQRDVKNSYPRFSARPEDIDGNAMQLINSGILSVDELAALGERFRVSNSTMARIVGKAMTDKADREANSVFLSEDRRTFLVSRGEELQNLPNPVEQLVDHYRNIAEASLRSESDGDFGTHIYDTLYAEHLADCTAAAEEFDTTYTESLKNE